MLIDFHYHCADAADAVDELLKDMDASGMDKTLLMGGPTDAYWEYRQCGFASNERVAKAVKAHPDRLIGNVYIEPREPDFLGTLKRYLDQGFRAVKLFPPVGFSPDEERLHPLYEEIERREVPVLAHAGQTNIKLISKEPKVRKATDSRFSNPMNFDQLARLFPKVIFVLAHMGYPFFTEAMSVAHANENVYLDISGSGPWTDGIPLVFNALGGHHYIPIDFKRVVWGSDNTLPQAEHMARMGTYLRLMGAGSEERKLIFGENAKRLLKI
ncbi:MAG: amidohydrolase [Spirochaetaceae bacterium]|nr:MAG: amidohydrolase [Spirochaetaceae bacterium]